MDKFETVDSLFEGLEVSDDVKSALSERVGVHTTGLKSKNTEVIGKLKATDETLTQLEKDKNLAAEKLATTQGNHEEAERLANKRRADEKEADDLKIEGYKGQLSDLYVTQAKTGLAKEIANTPEDIEILEMFLQKHITMEEVDGKMKTNYGEAGSREALIEQFKKDPIVSRFVNGTKAIGVGAKGADGSGKASVTDKPFNKMNMAEKKAYMDSKQ